MAREILCPACGGVMELKAEKFTIGLDGGGGLFSSLLYDQYEVDLYACPQCGKVEFYTAGFQKPEPEAEPKLETAAEEPQPQPEEPAPQGGGLFGFGKRDKDKRPPWER